MPDFTIPGVQIENPLDRLAKLTQLRGAQQQQQMQAQEAPLRMQALQQQVQTGGIQNQQAQQSLKDQQAKTAAMTEWDGNDINKLFPLIIKHGGSADAVMSLKSQVQEQQQKAAVAFKDMADGGKAQVETVKLKGDQVNGALAPLTDPTQVPDAQLPQALTTTVQDLLAKGLIDQPHAQAAQALLQSGGDPSHIRQQIGLFGKGLLAQSQVAEQAQKQAQTDKDKAETAVANMNLARGGSTDLDKFQTDYLQSRNLENTPANRQTAFKEYTKQTKIDPAQVRANVFMSMPQAVADPDNPGQTKFVTRKDAVGMEAPNSGDLKSIQATQKFFSPAGKGGQNLAAFNTAQNHLQLLGQASEALGNGNLTMLNDISQKYAKATGSAAPTNFDSVKNAVKGEVAKALTGNVTVSEQAELDKDFNNASSPKQIAGVIQKYTQLMQGKKEVLHQQYTDGMAGKVSFDDAAPAAAPTTHAFSLGAWQKANPQGDPKAAQAAAKAAGYQVTQ